MSEGIKDFFTPVSVATYAGATLAVYVFSNTVRKLFGRDSVWISFVIAMLVSFIGAYSAKLLQLEVVSVFVALLNGCLLFLGAAGAQETIAYNAVPKPTDVPKQQGRKPIKWTSSWFKIV